jgi:hypothetical protein
MNTNNYMTYENNDCSIEQNNAIRNDWRDRKCMNTNSGFNHGLSTNLRYDNQYITEDIQQSTAPLQSVMDPNRIKNCDQCLSLNGPIPSLGGWGDSIAISNPGLTPMQDLTDIDSVMSNRNVKATKIRRGNVNDVDVFKYKTYNSKECNKFLDPTNSLLTTPKQLYREMSINRFHNFNQNPQVNLYWNDTVNTQLEAKDNYDFPYPYSLNNPQNVPTASKNNVQSNKSGYKPNCSTKVMQNVAMNNSSDFAKRVDEESYDSDSDNSMSSVESEI